MIENLLRINSIIFLVFFISVSCKSKTEYKNNTELSLKSNDSIDKNSFIEKAKKIQSVKLPLSSLEYETCVEFDNVYFSITDTCNFKKEKINLDNYFSNELKLAKEGDFYKANEKTYYPIFRKENKRNIIIGSLVEYWFEDKKGVFLQLNTFDFNGDQIDFLIIFNRFKFETLYKYDFEISDSFEEIKMIKYSINDILYDEKTGDILQGDNENPKISNITEYYSLNENGFFVKE